MLAVGLLALGTAGPAGAGKIFTIDGNSNDENDIGGDDDVAFSFMGTTGSGAAGSSLVSGTIRAVDLSSGTAMLAGVESYIDFVGGMPSPNGTTMDFLVVDIVLDAGSALIDEIGMGVGGTNPVGTDPIGGGYFVGCDPGLPIGCAYNVLGGGETPYLTTAIILAPGSVFVPGAALFGYDKLNTSSDNLEAGETTRRLIVAYYDTGPQAPLSKVGQEANFFFSSGVYSDPVFVDIVPEPGTGLLVGLGLTMLTWVGRSRAR
jgi:hypothetical protein